MSSYVRRRRNAFELRTKDSLLSNPVYFTFDSEEKARAYGASVETYARDVVPEALVRQPAALFRDIAGAVLAYERAKSVPRSTASVLVTVSRDIGTTLLVSVDYEWAEEWVRSQKI